MAIATERARYPRSQRRLHWLMALLILAVYVAIDQRGLFARGSPGRTAMMQTHFWLGVTVFALAAWRLALRRRLVVPPITPVLSGWQAGLAKAMHVALYAFFLVMPLLGLCTLWASGRSLMMPFTGWQLPALIGKDHALAESIEQVHVTIGQVYYWVIGAHVAASLYHHFVRRDDTLRRML
jgi:cytochrome b561